MEQASGGTGKRSESQVLFADAHPRLFDLSLTQQYLDSVGLFQEAISSCLASVAKQERIRPSERTKAGMARRRAEGVLIGPPTKSVAVIEQLRELKKRGLSSCAISKALRVSASTVAKRTFN